ncbi:MAG: hypothetical protein OEY57_03210 [Nitrospirota bacterium]|nr:hypothetical protein [Nitrospirota bacterium]
MMKNRVSGVPQIVLWIVVGMVVGSVTSLHAFNRHITEDPTKTLDKYLSLDKKGARLETSSWQVIAPYVEWTEDVAWGQVVVISNFHIEQDVTKWDIVNGLEAKIPVVFDVLGTMHWESVTFVPDPHQESYLFHIKAVYDRWQIVHPHLPPHVGRQRLMDFVRWTELSEPEESRKALYASLHQQLKAK